MLFLARLKVTTSRCFLWYLGLLPISLPGMGLSKREGFTCLVVWIVTQASWHLPAYYLELQGSNTFRVVWMECLAFFTANIGLLSKFIRKYREFRAVPFS